MLLNRKGWNVGRYQADSSSLSDWYKRLLTANLPHHDAVAPSPTKHYKYVTAFTFFPYISSRKTMREVFRADGEWFERGASLSETALNLTIGGENDEESSSWR